MTLLSSVRTTLVWLLVALCLPSTTAAASLELVNITLANNPTNVGFYIYVPDALAPNPAIVVYPHWCHGDAPTAYMDSSIANLSSEYGFIAIYPDSPNTVDKCWDVASNASLRHNGGGDSTGIVSMVQWTLAHYHADASRVFVTGVSSGAMMTNVLVGAYPEVFAAGSAWAGVALGCFAQDIAANVTQPEVVDYWNAACAAGQVRLSPAAWTRIVHEAYPAYPADGWRPKMQVLHGTADETLNYTNLGEEIKEWTAVLGLPGTPTRTQYHTPLANWTKWTYGQDDWFEAYRAWNVTHNIPVQDSVLIEWFDLACNATVKGSECFHWGQKRN
ncbi:Alpha/Beta hydrolase protein [Coniella lustricola]|uniref:Alpha/Beta hydrolase protein n=1 Tax=Coniella lustricola TaxID=2025994 RepID=A0A2T2ZS10_9PEZI|nr:Alpha/Beta hydrolase protein [Coniella lustricola]